MYASHHDRSSMIGQSRENIDEMAWMVSSEGLRGLRYLRVPIFILIGRSSMAAGGALRDLDRTRPLFGSLSFSIIRGLIHGRACQAFPHPHLNS